MAMIAFTVGSARVCESRFGSTIPAHHSKMAHPQAIFSSVTRDSVISANASPDCSELSMTSITGQRSMSEMGIFRQLTRAYGESAD